MRGQTTGVGTGAATHCDRYWYLTVDRVPVNKIYALPDAQKKDLAERIESRSGLRQTTYMKELDMGTAQYELITL
jgi:uncharacterized Fe-S center protein